VTPSFTGETAGMRHSQTSPSLNYDSRVTPISKPYLENGRGVQDKKPLSPFRKRSQHDSSFNERTSDEQASYYKQPVKAYNEERS
jgi:hypothetical protein